MENRTEKMNELVKLLANYASQEGFFNTHIENLYLFRGCQEHQRLPKVYDPCIIIGAQGKKIFHLDNRSYDYNEGMFLVFFLPMPIECEIIEANAEKPMLGAIITLDQNRLAQVALKMDRAEYPSLPSGQIRESLFFIGSLEDGLLDATLRLLHSLKSKSEAAVLGDATIDEIYFRILSDEKGRALRYLLLQRNPIHQISPVIEYIHQNLDESISIQKLAGQFNMSSSVLYRKFKEVMQLSPLQYAKAIKLNKAQRFIMDGKSVSEASLLVGYSSPAQFSREYKRHFGVVPSATDQFAQEAK